MGLEDDLAAEVPRQLRPSHRLRAVAHADRRTTIMVVEDEPALQRATQRTLENRMGYHLLLAQHGEDALARIDLGEPVDLVLSDLHLSGMDGLELYEQLCARGFRGKFVLTSGSLAEHLEETRTLPSGVAFLPRPWTLDELGRRDREGPRRGLRG